MVMISAPIKLPRIEPSPPRRLPPPMTTAAMICSSYPAAVAGEPDPPSWENRDPPAQHVHERRRARDRHAAQTGSALVGADRIDMPAKAGVAQEHGGADGGE